MSSVKKVWICQNSEGLHDYVMGVFDSEEKARESWKLSYCQVDEVVFTQNRANVHRSGLWNVIVGTERVGFIQESEVLTEVNHL